MNTLEDIAAHGNRGHHPRENALIVCADGHQVSVIAGGGTYCHPRPAMCVCAFGLHDGPQPVKLQNEVEHDYPGPYTHVEAWFDFEGDPECVPVAEVAAWIDKHGGEVTAILAERDRLRVALDDVVALHEPLQAHRTATKTCAECSDFYPCRTILTIVNHLKEKP